jgi:hypothetical protein
LEPFNENKQTNKAKKDAQIQTSQNALTWV